MQLHRVRGINTGGMQPEKMGDVEAFLPLQGGTIARCVLKGAVCIEQSPHDIISSCTLENDGVCDWRGCFSDGRAVYLENHRFLLMPRCKAGQREHDFDADRNGVMFVGERRGLDRVPPRALVRNYDGHMIEAEFRPLSRGQHWSKSVHADMLLKMDLSMAENYMRVLVEAKNECIANGPGTNDIGVNASHYTSRGPCLAQYIDELKSGIYKWSPPASSAVAAPRVQSATVVDASVKAGSEAVSSAWTLLYWFSGTNLTATGMRAQWESVNGGTCVYRETKLDENDSILSDAVYKADLSLINK